MRDATPSTTARKVALNILSLGSKPGMEAVLPEGIVEATAGVLAAAGVVGDRALRFARSRTAVSIYEAFDWMIPGQFEAFAHRKRFCEDQTRAGIAAGASQVLVLGAGYDTLAWRLAPEYAGVSFFEIDHPATARLKTQAIEELGAHDNLHLVAADLGERRLEDVLAATEPWSCEARCVVIAEGLTQYLTPAAVQELFVECGRISGEGSRIVFTHTGTGDDGRPDIGRWTGLTLWLLQASGEPWLWSIRPDELPGFLEDTGWTVAAPAIRLGVEYAAVGVH